MLLKENNPWVGLASYKSQDAARFYGREKETRQLSELIQSNYCTILYGKSGAGKTSLIQAGVCPLLSGEHFLPIPLKLEHSGSVPYARQITDKVEEEIRRIGGEVEFPVELPEGLDEDSRTWLFFHTANFWDAQNFRTVPAVFIDQFEEIFNLTADLSQVLGFFRTIDTLLQMTPPDSVTDAFAQTNTRLSFKEKPSFRLMLSLREDFLARLEDYSFNIPALRRNRIGLASMNGIQALEVITRPIPGLVQRDAALRILSKVTATDVKDDEYFLEKLQVDSCILSLFCTEIYNKSAESGKDGISMEVIDQFGNNIIQTYYERNMDAISPVSTRYLEAHLLTTNGFRNQVALEDLVPDHVKLEEIKELEASRIVRIETVNGTERVEFTHDVLCKVAADHRNAGNLKSEKRKATIRKIAYAMEVILHAGIIATFLHSRDLNQMDLLRGYPIILALVLLGFTAFFLIRLEHHSKRYKSPLLMVLCAVYSFVPLTLLASAPIEAPDDVAIVVVLYCFSGLVYPFIELAQQKRSQNLKFLRDSVGLKEDRDRWMAVLAFLLLSYGAAAVFAHRMVNETVSNLLLLFLPVLLLECVCFLFPDRIDKRARWTGGLMAEGGILLLILAQYRYSRLWYYAAILLLAASCAVFFLRIKDRKKTGWVATGAVWILLFLLLPTYILGYSPFALQRLARVPHGTIATESYPNMITVKDKYGQRGVVMRDEVILPAEFDDIRTYAISQHKDLELPFYEEAFDGTVHDLVFYVKEGGSDSWQELPLSQVFRVRNRITRAIAEDYRSALDAADSTYKRLFRASREETDKGGQKEQINQEEISFWEDWRPFRFAYDPAIHMFLAHQFPEDSAFCHSHIRKAAVLVSVMGFVRQFNEEDGWKFSNPLLDIAYADFYRHTHKTSNVFVQGYNDFMQEQGDRFDIFNDLLDVEPDIALETILESADLRAQAFVEFFKDAKLDLFYRLLSLKEPVTRAFMSRLCERTYSSTSSQAFYALFQNDYPKAESLARSAVDSAEDLADQGIAVTNLVPALFLNGNEAECREVLDRYAFSPTSNGFIVIDALYQDIKDFLHHGVFQRNTSEYDRYIQLLRSYSENVFQNRKLSTWSNSTVYFKKRTPFSTFNQLFDVLYFNSPTTKSYDELFLSYGQTIGLAIVNGKKGYIDLDSGREIYPVQADHAWLFSEGLGVIEEAHRIRVIDIDGEPAFEKTFEDPRDFDSPDFVPVDFVYHDGVCTMIDPSGRFGLIDTEGNWVIQPEYDYITNPDETGYRHLLKDGTLTLLGHLELESLKPAPSTPLMVADKYRVQLWDPRGDRWVTSFDGEYAIRSVSGVSGQTLVMTLADRDSVTVFSRGQKVVLPSVYPEMTARMSPTDNQFVTYISASSTAYLTDLATQTTEGRFTVNSDAGFIDFCFSRNGRRCLSAHTDRSFRVWDVATGECLSTLMLTDYCDYSPLSFALSPDGSCLLIGLQNSSNNVLFQRIGQEPVLLNDHDDWVRDVDFSRDGKWFATCSDDATVLVYDTQTLKKLKTIETHGDWLFYLAISPDGHLIATMDEGRKLCVWDVTTRSCVNTYYMDFSISDVTQFTWPENR